MSEELTGYMCKTDYEFELYSASGGVAVYPSIDDLIKRRKCAVGCGIVEVRVELVRVISEGIDP